MSSARSMTILRELKSVHVNVMRLMGLAAQPNWGIPTHQSLLSKWITDLDECFKKVQVR